MSQVTTGLERWLGEGIAVAGLPRRAQVGILAHPASVDRRGRHVVECLLAPGDVEVVRLFAPEHGLWGREQDMEPVDAAVDPVSGLPVVSLYGREATSLRPAASDLEGLDAVVVDLQDVGSRYYTFVYTMAHVMQTAAESGVAVVVLDRPNPLGGLRVDGPVLEQGLLSFVGRYPLAVRHGMTIGELALMFNDAHGIGCDLRLVEMQRWTRADRFEHCGLPWVAPSPNMPSVETAAVYPGGCLVEGTNLSEGRGTTLPFQLVGAPWLDGAALAEAMRREELPGLAVRAASFRPMFQKHAGQACQGVQMIPTDPARFEPFSAYLALLREARLQDPGAFRWRSEPYEFEESRLAIDLLLGRADLRPMIERGASVDEMVRNWLPGLASFDERRRAFLRYA